MSRIALAFILRNGGAAYLARPMLNGMLGGPLYQVEAAPVISRHVFAAYREPTEKPELIQRTLAIIADQ